MSSAVSVEYCNRNILRNLYGEGMTKKLTDIAQRQRESIRRIIKARGLEIKPLCKKAGFSEATLRHLLNDSSKKPTRAMGSEKVEALADAIGVSVNDLLGIQPVYQADEDLMRDSANAIFLAAKSLNKKLSLEQVISLSVELYNHVMQYRSKGTAAGPTEALAALILRQMVA